MYAVVAPFLFEKEYASQMKHNIASQSFVRFQKHHLVSWIQYHPASEYSVHYFGQVRFHSSPPLDISLVHLV